VSYVRKNLEINETVIFEAKQHWIVIIKPLCLIIGAFFLMSQGYDFLIILGTIWFLVGLIWLMKVILLRASTEYAVTNERIIIKKGVVARNVKDIKLRQIEGTQVVQGIIGRIFSYGTLRIRGTGQGEQTYYYITKILDFQRCINVATPH
jgi:uncharacterized membrane protein YdbT with pleckstrin-like domain